MRPAIRLNEPALAAQGHRQRGGFHALDLGELPVEFHPVHAAWAVDKVPNSRTSAESAAEFRRAAQQPVRAVLKLGGVAHIAALPADKIAMDQEQVCPVLAAPWTQEIRPVPAVITSLPDNWN